MVVILCRTHVPDINWDTIPSLSRGKWVNKGRLRLPESTYSPLQVGLKLAIRVWSSGSDPSLNPAKWGVWEDFRPGNLKRSVEEGAGVWTTGLKWNNCAAISFFLLGCRSKWKPPDKPPELDIEAQKQTGARLDF